MTVYQPYQPHYPVRADIPGLTEPSLTVNHMAEIWASLEKEGKAERLFYDGCVQSEADFIDYLTEPDIYAYAVYAPDWERPLAVYWLNNFLGHAALMHFAYLEAGLAERYTIGIDTCNFLLRGSGGQVSALIGITPKPFRHAWQFALAVGFVKLGIIPKACPILNADGSIRLTDAVATLCIPETLKQPITTTI
jgi:hypothetical protein